MTRHVENVHEVVCVPSECDDVIRREHVSKSRGLPHREVTDSWLLEFSTDVHDEVNATVQNDRVVNVAIVSSVDVEPVEQYVMALTRINGHVSNAMSLQVPEPSGKTLMGCAVLNTVCRSVARHQNIRTSEHQNIGGTGLVRHTGQ